jgi:amidohydrolase
MLIGAAHLLKSKDFNGTVKFIFQPSEEGNYDDPEKKSGGKRIVDSGELEGVHTALALHVHPLLPVGQIAYKLGEALACCGFFKMTVTGKSGHAGAAPHMAVDAIFISSSLIQATQAVVSRYTDPMQPVVISFTQINGGFAPNIIADKVYLEGTVRALDLKTYEEVKEKIKTIGEGIATTYGATFEIEYVLDYPSLLNHKAVHDQLVPALHSVFSNKNVIEAPAILGGEDFAFYSREVPAMFYFLGARDLAETCFFLHHPMMVVNEECIRYGAEFLSEAAIGLMDS